jgi:hypothetical protein
MQKHILTLVEIVGLTSGGVIGGTCFGLYSGMAIGRLCDNNETGNFLGWLYSFPCAGAGGLKGFSVALQRGYYRHFRP